MHEDFYLAIAGVTPILVLALVFEARLPRLIAFARSKESTARTRQGFKDLRSMEKLLVGSACASLVAGLGSEILALLVLADMIRDSFFGRILALTGVIIPALFVMILLAFFLVFATEGKASTMDPD